KCVLRLEVVFCYFCGTVSTLLLTGHEKPFSRPGLQVASGCEMQHCSSTAHRSDLWSPLKRWKGERMGREEKMSGRDWPHQDNRKRPTLVDVAREAGVGTTTVSRIINGGHYVKAGTFARVQAVMKTLGYQPSHAARAMKGERTRILGLIVPSLKDEFFANLADAVQTLARKKDYVLIVLASADDATQETREIAVFESYRVDGMLVVPPRVQTQDFLSAVRGMRVPVVAIDRPLQSRGSSVTCDNYEASLAATQHLIQHGRRRILCLGSNPDLYTIQERQRGYEAAAREAGLKVDILSLANVELLANKLKARLGESARRRPDAIFCLLNVAAVIAYQETINIGLSITKDVALIGFDDFPLSSILRPAISVVRQPVSEIARAATNLIFEQIETGIRTPHRMIVETKFIQRDSCGCTGEGS
ncbi:MAG: LacI family transcriptional regulator, partial [Acidobacteriota bacterium]|nr:LacI family transcriptional regulator [Acidobacteriota bacterium]